MNTKDFIRLGIPLGEATRRATDFVSQFILSGGDKTKLAEELKAIVANPALFADDPMRKELAKAIGNAPPPPRAEPVKYRQWGEGLEHEAVMQMEKACLLPIAVAGALMPDAHSGYGLPIGGVLATENAVIPYGVGVDIGCRMCLSVFDIDPKELTQREHYFTRELNEMTLFGSGGQFDKITDHEVLDRREFNELSLLKGLQTRAARQLGTSGSGNHFVEFGSVEIIEKDDILGLEPGVYLGLLSHSGSRALGANIA